MFFRFRSLVAAVALCIAPAVPAQAPLRLAYVAPASVWGPVADQFAQQVQERTKGSVRIQTFGGGQLGNLPLSLAGLRTGQVDMVLTDTGALALTKGGKDMNVLSAPYAFRDQEHFRAFLASPLWREMLDPAQKEGGFTYVGHVSDSMPRQLTNSVRPVKSPEDLKGLKIRVPENQLFLETMKAWGASPVPIPGSELYLSLKQGLVHGQDNGFDTIVAAKFYEVQKFATRVDYVRSVLLVVVSTAKWNRLTAAEREALVAAAAETDRVASARLAASESSLIATMREHGVQLAEPDLKPFRTIADDVNRRFDGELWSKGLLSRIQAIR